VTVFLLLWLAAAPERRNPEQKFFEDRVAPILTRRCVSCHNEELRNGGLSLLDRESLLAGGGRGPAVEPGKPEESVLIQALRHEGELQMPPGPALPAKEVRVLREWVRRGAIWGCQKLR